VPLPFQEHSALTLVNSKGASKMNTAIKQLDKIYSEKLNSCFSGDVESDHSVADDLLCELLEVTGFKKTVEKYKEVKKWYA
jgi:hypothetical protein